MNTSELEFSPPSISESDSRPDAARAFRRQLFWLLSLVVLVLVAGAGTWLLAQGRQGSPFPGPQPSFGTLTTAPLHFIVNTPTTVTFTIRIDTPTLNPTTVELQRIDADGTFIAAVGRMYDIGQGGDVKAGDRIFTTQVALNESEARSLYFRVAAAFRGNQQNAFSSSAALDPWSSTSTSMGLAISYPSAFTISPLAPSSDPAGINGFVIEDPTTAEYPNNGVSISIVRFAAVRDIVAALDIPATVHDLMVTANTGQWRILVFRNTNTDQDIIVALAQRGTDVLRMGATYSPQKLALVMDMISALQ